MRLVFLYVTYASAPNIGWDPKLKATNYYSLRVKEEGYFYLLKRMLEEKIVDEVVVVVESALGQGYTSYGPNFHGWVMPDISNLPLYLNSTDIIWVRGGFKHWYKTLVKMKEDNYRMLLYAANTGRERWPIWDVIFNDLNGNNKVDSRGTLQFDFKKPTNPNIFYPTFVDPVYDLCIGASYIHDKKGQWKSIEALIEYNKIFGKHLKCVMPGAFRRSTKTLKMIEVLKQNVVDVELCGMVSRTKLNKIYNRSKVFVHLGGGGQGDRGPLEAMRTGVPVVVGNTKRHSRVIYQNTDASLVIPEGASIEQIARAFHYMVGKYSKKLRKQVYSYYEKSAGIEKVILPEMKDLFDFLKEAKIKKGESSCQKKIEQGHPRDLLDQETGEETEKETTQDQKKAPVLKRVDEKVVADKTL